MNQLEKKYAELLNLQAGYVANGRFIPKQLQNKNKDLVYEFNQIKPSLISKKIDLLDKILGNRAQVLIEAPFHCDYGFNIHFHGKGFVNYNSVFLDTSPINIGKNCLIGPGAIFSCAGHSLDADERMKLATSQPITLKDNVWLGARVTVLAGVTIGKNCVIGAGSVVTKDIPSNCVAVGTPCQVLRKIDVKDKIASQDFFKGKELS